MSGNFPITEDFKKAIGRLDEVLRLEKTVIIRDSAIKRFEIAFDLSWKSIKVYAKEQGLECISPRSCFKMAFQLGLIEYDERWLRMVDDRNLTAHLYKEEHADAVYERMPDYLKLFRSLLIRLSENSRNSSE